MHYSYYKRPLFLLLILYIGLLALFYTPRPGKQDVFHAISSQPVTVTGKVVGFPTHKKKSRNVIIQVQTVNGIKSRGYLYARFKNYTPLWHETLQLTGKLKKPYSINLLGNFDWGAYLATRNVFTEMKVASVEIVRPPSWPARMIAAVREDILDTFEKNFSRNLSAIAGGVLLGERGEIEEDLYTDFQDSGAIHLLVASGGNVGFVTLVVFAFCALFGLGRRRTALCALIIAGIYTLIAGADTPLTRAYFMTVCAVAGYFLRRNSGVFQGLILSCLLILLRNPSALFETGFQMSFLATFAIVVCLNNYELPYRWPRLAKFFAQIFMATLSTQLVLLPVFTNIFFKVSFVGLFSNMILVPLASFLMALSFLFYVFSCLHVGFLLKAITGASLWCFGKLVSLFAALPFASVPAAAWRVGEIIAYYCVVFLLFHLPQKTFLRRIYKPLLLLALLAPVVQYVFFNPPTLWMLNEWNKNAILLRLPSGKRVLIGAEIEGEKLARAVLKSGGRKLEAVFLTTQPGKQTVNLEALQEKIKVKQIFLPFETIWPGEKVEAAGCEADARWGLMLNRAGEIWTNKGYSGKDDTLSYKFLCRKKQFVTAGNARFVILGEEIISNKQNDTQQMNL